MKYVRIDCTVNSSGSGSGFSNTKEILAFHTKREAVAFIEGRYYDLSCKLVNRSSIKLSQCENLRSFFGSGVVLFKHRGEDFGVRLGLNNDSLSSVF